MTLRLGFLRHARTPWNAEHRLQGRTDIPLSEGAMQDLNGLALPAPWDAVPIWTSPLTRARQTAEALGHEPRIAPELIEMNWGAWEGQRGTDLREDAASGYRDIEDWGWHFTPPDGECPDDVRQRVQPWMNAQAQTCLVVSHIGVMRVACALATGWAFDGPCPFAIKRNRIYVLRKTGEGWCLEPETPRLEPRP